MGTREIKFRAWNEREIFYPTQITFLGGGSWSVEKGRGVSIEAQPHITLMQFTGLTDKNGKEIYEGDIVKYSHGIRSVWEVVADMASGSSLKIRDFHIDDNNDVSDPVFIDWKKCEVIGNIYENPDLLK